MSHRSRIFMLDSRLVAMEESLRSFLSSTRAVLLRLNSVETMNKNMSLKLVQSTKLEANLRFQLSMRLPVRSVTLKHLRHLKNLRLPNRNL